MEKKDDGRYHYSTETDKRRVERAGRWKENSETER
jgi:hypothetical protein